MPTVKSSIVEMVVFRKSGKGPHYLILRRASSDDLFPGMWQIITGAIESGEKPLAAALRELDEETSLAPVRLWVVPLVDTFFDPKTDSVQMCPLFAAEVDASAEVTLSPEHEGHRWVGREGARKLLVWPGHHNAIETVHQYIFAGREAARLTEIKLNQAERKSQ